MAGEMLHTDSAGDAWRSYLRADRGSEWAKEASQRLEALSRARCTRDRTERRRQFINLAPRAAQADVEQLVACDPQTAREVVEEDILTHWGEMVRSGQEVAAGHDLNLARAIGSALARRGERMIADTVATIDQARSELARSRLADLAQGHASYGKGLAAASQS